MSPLCGKKCPHGTRTCALNAGHPGSHEVHGNTCVGDTPNRIICEWESKP